MDTTRERLEHVSVVARRAVQIASLLGNTFSFDHVAAMLDVPPASLLAPVEELVHADVLVDDGTAVTFADDSLRQAVFETLPRPAWPALQRQAIDVLLRAGASPIEPATGLARTARIGDRSAIAALLEAARAPGLGDPALAAELTRRAFDLTTPGDERRGTLAAETSLLLHAADRAEEGKAFADAALRECTAPETEAQIRISIAEMPALSPEARVRAGRAALAVPGVTAEWRARHLSRLVDNLLEMGRCDAAHDLLPEVVNAVDCAADPVATLALKLARSRLAYMDGAFRAALRHVEPPHRGPAGRDHRAAVTDQWRAEALLVLDQFEPAQRAAAQGVATARCGRDAWAERSWRQLQGRSFLQAGRIADAAASLEGVLPVAGNAPVVTNVADAAALLALGRIAIHQGDGRGARASAKVAESALEHEAPEVRRHVTWFLALQAHAGGDSIRARARLADLEENFACSVLPLLMVDIADPVLLVRIALAAGDETLAASAVLTAERRYSVNPGVNSVAATAAQARGLLTRDVDALADAARLFGSSLRPLAQGSAYEDYGLELVRRGDHAGGVAELSRALRTYSDTGATWDTARVRSRLRELGVRSRLVKTVRPAGGWAGLTDSEIAVARLVAEGLKNREVAERLFVSRHTVSMHLRNAFTKLNINSRVELTRLVFEIEQAA
jgi:DNA-binding CsgD family transcriptional regulator